MRKRIKLAGILIICLFCLLGCDKIFKSKKEQQSIDMVIIVGAHANTPKPDFEVIEDEILEVCRIGGSSITIIVDDGIPFKADSINIQKLKPGFSDDEYEQAAQKYKNQVLEAAKKAIAQEAEVDILTALDYAVRELNNKNGEIKKIIMLDNGLSTTGVLDFTAISLEARSSDEIVELIEAKKEIPDFTKINCIKIYGIANVCEPQKKLTGLYKDKLKDVWRGILTKGGAQEVDIIDTVPSNEHFERDEVPMVSTISIIEEPDKISENEFTGTVFTVEKIGFIKNTAELENKETAKEVLSDVISYMQNHIEFKVLLVGTTAKFGDIDGCIALSKSRAQAIKQLLEESGIDGARIEIIGTGYNNPYYKREDIIEDDFDEDIAAKNRSVVILDRSSGTAQNIIDNTWENIYIDN